LKQFLILTFSRRACNDFIDKGKKQNKILFTTKNIRTIHSVAGKIIYNIMEKKSSSQDTVIISSIDLMENNKEEILEMDEFNNLKVIFVDEAQDISYIQYKFILKIS
jgi:superfamily I DNA/RNA helicase